MTNRMRPMADGYTCSDRRPDAPDAGHYQWHRRHGTEPCYAAHYGSAWSDWLLHTPGRDPDVYHTLTVLTLSSRLNL